MRTFALILLALVSLLRLGGPAICACPCGGESGALGMSHGESTHAHVTGLGCDGCAGSCEECPRCRAAAAQLTDASIPRVIEAQRHPATLLPTLILDAFHAAAALHDLGNADRLAESTHAPVRPPPSPGVAVVRVTVRIV